MARLWTCGFETGSTREFEYIEGNYQFNAIDIRSGVRSLRFAADGTGTVSFVDHHVASTNTEHLHVRAYIYLREYPNDTTPIILGIDTVDVATASIRVNSDGTLSLYDQLTEVSTRSSALSLETWYMVDLWTKSNNAGDQGAVARLDGTEFASVSSLSGGSRWYKLRFGVAPSSANTNPTFDINFDDIAVNDGTGSHQNSYPGSGRVVHLHPNAAGDSNEWDVAVGGTAGISNNWTRVDEMAVDDLSSYNEKPETGNYTDLFNVESSSTAGIPSGAPINVVQVGVYAGSNNTATSSRYIKLLLESDSGGTVAESGQIPIYVNTDVDPFCLHTVVSPFIYQMTSYEDPDGGDWTTSKLDTMQIGYANWFSTGNDLRVSKVWALVEYDDFQEENSDATINAEASGSATGTKTASPSSDASTTVSGTSSGTSARSSEASASALVSGTTSETAAGPQTSADGIGSVSTSASATTNRVTSASVTNDVDSTLTHSRESSSDATGSTETTLDSSSFKTAQSPVNDEFRMTGLVDAVSEEDLIFPIQLHVELMVDGSWVDITGDVRATEPVTIERGRANEATEADASTLQFKLNNRHGKYSPRNPNSEYYTKIGRNTPIRVYVTQGDITMHRFIGEVYEWPSRWDLSDTDVWINIEASGILRRLNQGSQPLESALVRYIMSQSPHMYYPLTDGRESGFRAPARVGRGDYYWLTKRGGTEALVRPEWQGGDVAPWLEPMVRVADTVLGIGRGPVNPGSGHSWSVDHIRTGVGGTDEFMIATYGDAGIDVWTLGESPAADPPSYWLTWETRGDDGSFSQLLLFEDAPGALLFDDEPHHVRLETVDQGATVDWTVYIDGEEYKSGSVGTTGKEVTDIGYEWWRPEASNFPRMTFGHVTVWEEDNTPLPQDVTKAMLGYPGEKSGRRIERICSENGIALEVNGDLDDTPRMGPQRIENILTLLRQAEAVDGGMLHESRLTNALLYRTNRSRYNQIEESE